MSSTLARWGGLAAMVAGLLLAVKGAAIIATDYDPSFVPPATLLFALGMVGLHARLPEGAGRWARRASSSPGSRSASRR